MTIDIDFSCYNVEPSSTEPPKMVSADVPNSQTWFDIQQTKFCEVPVAANNEVSTTEFLQATECMTTIFDLLGSAVFTPIKQDLVFNIGRVRIRHQEAPEISATLQSLVKAELSLKLHPGTDGLIWIVRGLDFMAHAFKADLRTEQTDKEEHRSLVDSFKTSYDQTLAPYHNAFIRLIFKAAMNAAPKRKGLYKRLSGDGVSSQSIRESMQEWTAALEKIVSILKEFLAGNEALNKWARTKV